MGHGEGANADSCFFNVRVNSSGMGAASQQRLFAVCMCVCVCFFCSL